MKMSDRAKQFMPFASLRGYYQEIRKREIVPQEKRELTEEQAVLLSNEIKKVKKGDIIDVTYFLCGEYKRITGVVTAIDLALKRLTVVKTTISFEDVNDLEKISENNL